MNTVESNIESMSLEEIMDLLKEHIKEWGLPTRAARREKRITSSFEELQHFHQAINPFMSQIIEQLNEHPVAAIPAQYKNLVYTTFAFIEVDCPVHKLKQVLLDGATDPRRGISKPSYHDFRLPFDANQEYQRQVNYRDHDDKITLI